MKLHQRVLALKVLLWKHRWALLLLFLGIAVPMALLEELMEGVHRQHDWALDEQILQMVHRRASPRKDFVIYWATLLGYWFAVPALLGIISVLLYVRNSTAAAYFALTVLGAWLMSSLVKLFFGRPRPDLWTSILPEKSYSFPSGHSMISMALGFAIVILLWPTRWRLPALLLAPPAVFVVGVSRLYLGVHYPSDVLGGWSAGLIWATGVYMICRRYLRAALPGEHP